MAVRLSALLAGLPLPPRIFLVLIYVRGWFNPRAIVRLEVLGQLKKSNVLMGTWTHDLPACSIAPQPTTLPRVLRRVVCNAVYSWRHISPEINSEDFWLQKVMEDTCFSHCTIKGWYDGRIISCYILPLQQWLMAPWVLGNFSSISVWRVCRIIPSRRLHSPLWQDSKILPTSFKLRKGRLWMSRFSFL
jgi:hypothetical protein